MMMTLPKLFRRPAPHFAGTTGIATQAGTLTPATADRVAPDQPMTASGCGWFDSSWALHQGLAVSELPASDWPVAALWFGSAVFSGSGCSGAIRLQ